MNAIRIDAKTHRRLNELKAAGNIKTFNETINAIIDYCCELLIYKQICQEKGIDVNERKNKENES